MTKKSAKANRRDTKNKENEKRNIDSSENESQSEKTKSRFGNMWFVVSVLLAILLVASIFTNGFGVLGNSNSCNTFGLPTAGIIDQGTTEKSKIGEDYVEGSENAPVTIIEYSEFQCPYCSRFYTETYPEIKEQYIDTGKVKLIFRHFPLSFHANAQKAAEAAECAGEQGKFWEMHDLMFENQQSIGVDDLKGYATDLGLDAAKFNDCLDSGKYKSKIESDIQKGKQAGVSGTPSFLINNQLVVGAQPFAKFKETIDAALSGGTAVVADNEQPSNPTEPIEVSVDDDPSKGSEDASITIVEFSDFQCPYCARFYTETLPQITEQYIDTGKVKFVYRDYPLTSLHANAQKAAEAAECADEQGKFWEMHDKLYENQQALGIDNLKGYATDLGLDAAKFNDCLDSGKYESEVKKDLSDGQKYGVSGTPSFFINGKMMVGAQPFENFKEAIDAELS